LGTLCATGSIGLEDGVPGARPYLIGGDVQRTGDGGGHADEVVDRRFPFTLDPCQKDAGVGIAILLVEERERGTCRGSAGGAVDATPDRAVRIVRYWRQTLAGDGEFDGPPLRPRQTVRQTKDKLFVAEADEESADGLIEPLTILALDEG